MPQLNAPTLLTADHQVGGFESGKQSLDDWLQRRALKNQTEGASRTYVVTSNDAGVLACYALAAGSVIAAEATGTVRRNMPSPIPVVILARLAVDRSLQGKGFGTALIRDALLKTVRAADTIGVAGACSTGAGAGPVGPSVLLADAWSCAAAPLVVGGAAHAIDAVSANWCVAAAG